MAANIVVGSSGNWQVFSGKRIMVRFIILFVLFSRTPIIKVVSIKGFLVKYLRIKMDENNNSIHQVSVPL